NAHFVHVPYNTFTTKDGFIVIAVITNEFWYSLLEVVKIDKLRDPKYSEQKVRLSNQLFIEHLLNKKLSEQTTAYWLEKLSAARVPCAPVNKFSDALSDEQVLHRNMVVEVFHPEGGSVNMPGNPVKLSQNSEEIFTPPPLLGQHTQEILESLNGYTKEQIESLIEEGVIS
ncbi:MAG: CoA transferase, partial [Pseudomonadota bacterium]|nr:CoA transferase [Pseudomonadota bacterium]